MSIFPSFLHPLHATLTVKLPRDSTSSYLSIYQKRSFVIKLDSQYSKQGGVITFQTDELSRSSFHVCDRVLSVQRQSIYTPIGSRHLAQLAFTQYSLLHQYLVLVSLYLDIKHPDKLVFIWFIFCAFHMRNMLDIKRILNWCLVASTAI